MIQLGGIRKVPLYVWPIYIGFQTFRGIFSLSWLSVGKGMIWAAAVVGLIYLTIESGLIDDWLYNEERGTYFVESLQQTLDDLTDSLANPFFLIFISVMVFGNFVKHFLLGMYNRIRFAIYVLALCYIVVRGLAGTKWQGPATSRRGNALPD